MSRTPLPFWRKIYYVNPRLQGRAALIFAAIVAAGGVLFGVSAFLYVKQAVRSASLQGHFMMNSAYEVVRTGLAWRIFGLFAGVSLAGTAAFLLLLRTTEHALRCVIGALRASSGGDLSTPTEAGGFSEFRRFGEQVDEARAFTLSQMRELRAEASSVAQSGAAGDEFRLRWDMLKQKIRKVAP